LRLAYHPSVRLLAYTQPAPNAGLRDSEHVVAYAIRECYDSHGKSNDASDAKLVASIASREESPIEHAVFTFEIECSRACSHQIVRHRIASYSQRSQRYVKEKDPEFYCPESMVGDVLYEAVLRDLADNYTHMLSFGRKPEDARYLLPNATMTKIVMTVNARSLTNFLNLRLDKRAQAEIRQVAEQMRTLVLEVCPNLFKKFEVEEEPSVREIGMQIIKENAGLHKRLETL
jgi:thymidylate synthase (FAD)